MEDHFFQHPILNSPYECPTRHWELDTDGQSRIYRPDFIVLVDDGHGEDDLLHLVVEIKGYRREDAKDKAETMRTYWIPGVNNSGKFGRWAFEEFTEVYAMEADFAAKIEAQFNEMMDKVGHEYV